MKRQVTILLMAAGLAAWGSGLAAPDQAKQEFKMVTRSPEVEAYGQIWGKAYQCIFGAKQGIPVYTNMEYVTESTSFFVGLGQEEQAIAQLLKAGKDPNAAEVKGHVEKFRGYHQQCAERGKKIYDLICAKTGADNVDIEVNGQGLALKRAPGQIECFRKFTHYVSLNISNSLPEEIQVSLDMADDAEVTPLIRKTRILPGQTGLIPIQIETGNAGARTINVKLRSKDKELSIPLQLQVKAPARLKARIVDSATGGIIAARVRPLGAQGEFYIITNSAPDCWGGLGLGGKGYRYSDGEFELDFLPGKLDVELIRGFEYIFAKTNLQGQAGETIEKEFRLERWINMKAKGWYSGDHHIHYLSPQSAFLEMKGEDLCVANVLVTKWGEVLKGGPPDKKKEGEVTSKEFFEGKPNKLSLIHI